MYLIILKYTNMLEEIKYWLKMPFVLLFFIGLTLFAMVVIDPQKLKNPFDE